MTFPPGDRGVPLSQLRCPTCSSSFRRQMHDRSSEWNPIDNPALLDVVMPEPPSLVCIKNGHKWSIKALYKTGNGETEVLLDRYLGTV